MIRDLDTLLHDLTLIRREMETHTDKPGVTADLGSTYSLIYRAEEQFEAALIEDDSNDDLTGGQA